jgi:hypothetical protein
MAALTVVRPTSTGATPPAPAQITAYSGTGDTIDAGNIGERGVVAIVANASGGSLNFQVSDAGTTPAGNPAANGFTTIAVPNSSSRWVFIGKNNIDPSTGLVKVGASTSNASFTVTVLGL